MDDTAWYHGSSRFPVEDPVRRPVVRPTVGLGSIELRDLSSPRMPANRTAIVGAL